MTNYIIQILFIDNNLIKFSEFTTLHKRISKQDLGIDIPEKDAVVAVDSTGIKITNRWDWMY